MQMHLMHETINEALREVVQVVGGYKDVGSLMFPELPVEHAAGKVRDCLNADRRERFTPDQVLYLACLGRQHRCHAIVHHLCREAGYAEPVPLEPEDEMARLQRDFIEATKKLEYMTSRIGQIDWDRTKRVP